VQRNCTLKGVPETSGVKRQAHNEDHLLNTEDISNISKAKKQLNYTGASNSTKRTPNQGASRFSVGHTPTSVELAREEKRDLQSVDRPSILPGSARPSL